MENNLSTTPSIKLLFVYIFSFLAFIIVWTDGYIKCLGSYCAVNRNNRAYNYPDKYCIMLNNKEEAVLQR
jgi:hypothetical protein